MSKNSYFSKFPIINYANTTATNITKRSVILNSVYNNPFNFYPWELNSSIRPDTLSQQYYKDEFFSWIIYLSNQIIDPYYGWYLDQDQFNNFIVAKYGSISYAQSYIKNYQVNWRNNPEIIDIGYFNILAPNEKKYWDLNTSQNANVVSYKRAQLDWTANTNYILQFDLNGNFIDGENILLYQNNIYVGKGTYISGTITNIDIESTFVDLTNILYQIILLTGNCVAVGDQSNISCQITQYQIMALNIPLDEYSYWEPVSFYDYEYNKNEENKNILLLDSTYSPLINKNLAQLGK